MLSMSYELQPDVPLGKNLRRLFRRQLNDAISLAKGEGQPNDTLVHDFRKHLKKARAALQLVRAQAGKRTWRRQHCRLLDAGRLTREVRDAEVRLQTMRQLEDAMRRHYLSYQKIERLLAEELESFRAAFADWEIDAIRLLERAKKSTTEWHLRACKEKHVRRAIRRTYEAARNALRIARKRTSVASIHELRKHVKLLGYQVSLIRPWNHLVIGEAQEELTDLGHLLGRIHDLAFLGDRLRFERREKHWGKQDDELLAAIEATEAMLRRDGIEIADRIFAERPRKFARYIDEWFTDRRHTRLNHVAEILVNA